MKRIVLILAITLTACSKESDNNEVAIPVDAQIVHQENIPYTLSYPAIVQGVVDYAVVPRVSGTLYEQYYQEGSFVKRNQALYKIDPRPFELQLKSDEGQLIKDLAARNNYQKIYQRYQSLYHDQAVSAQEVETARIHYFTAMGNVKTDEANIEKEKLNLRYCLVRSPIDGYIGERLVSVGTMVTAFQTVLNHINSVNQMYVLFSMPENQRLEIEEGVANKTIAIPQNNTFQIDIELANGKKIPHAGEIEFADTRISLENGAWNMRANVNNEALVNKLLSGQYVSVYLHGMKYLNVVSVPQNAVLFDNESAYVYLVENNKAILRHVTTGKMLNAGQWIITQGLNKGDVIITAGQAHIQNDSLISVDHLKE